MRAEFNMPESCSHFDIDLKSKKIYNNLSDEKEPLRRAYGEPVKFTAFTSSTDNTIEIANGKLWRPFTTCTNNVINIDMGEEIDLASVEFIFEKNKTDKYEYCLYGIKDDEAHVLCKRTSEKNIIFEKAEGRFRYLVFTFLSASDYIDEEACLVAGIEKLRIYRAYRKTEPPKLLNTITGYKVTDIEMWETIRRDEVKNLCERYLYGIRDIEKPDNLYFNVEKTYEIYGITCKEIYGGFGNFKFPFKLYLPKNVEKPLPAFIYVAHENIENSMKFDKNGNVYYGPNVIPIKYLTDRGYAIAVMPTREIYREWHTHSNYKVGVFKEVNAPRTKYSWASLSAWAWGVSRVLDYLETEPMVDETRVASIGHSRSGKAALWAAATDERIFLCVPNNSGCCGAAILRGKTGEHARMINDYSDWLCAKFKDYDDCEDLLPMDQHFVLSLVAPRNIYVCDSILDELADPDAEFWACQLASPVWELYGKKGLVMDDEKPVIDKVYQEGDIAYHVKTGDHSQTMFDWENVINYFDSIK